MTKDEPSVSKANVTAIILIWYCIAIIASRLVTMVISPGIGVSLEHGYHFHHILWGLVLMAVGGFFGLYWSEKLPILTGSWFMGMGLGLAVDEVGLVLFASEAIDGYFALISYPMMILVAQVLFIAYLAARKQNR